MYTCVLLFFFFYSILPLCITVLLVHRRRNSGVVNVKQSRVVQRETRWPIKTKTITTRPYVLLRPHSQLVVVGGLPSCRPDRRDRCFAESPRTTAGMREGRYVTLPWNFSFLRPPASYSNEIKKNNDLLRSLSSPVAVMVSTTVLW